MKARLVALFMFSSLALWFLVHLLISTYEYVAQLNNFQQVFTFTYWLILVKENLYHLWDLLGRQFAWLSSFLNHFQKHIIGVTETFFDLSIYVWRIAFSWLYFFLGYFKTVAGYAYPKLVIIGSTILIMVVMLSYRYFKTKKWQTAKKM